MENSLHVIKVYLPSLVLRRELNSLKWGELKRESEGEEMCFSELLLSKAVRRLYSSLAPPPASLAVLLCYLL